MTITDQQRREVAENLRSYLPKDEDELGAAIVSVLIARDMVAKNPAQTLADLIDRNACHAVQPAPGAFYECDRCGYDGWADAERFSSRYFESFKKAANRHGTCIMTYCESMSYDEIYPTMAYTCSACKKTLTNAEGDYEFCPYCGARIESFDGEDIPEVFGGESWRLP